MKLSFYVKICPHLNCESVGASNQLRNHCSSIVANLLACKILPVLIEFYCKFCKSVKVRMDHVDTCLCEFLQFLFFIILDTK